MSEIDQILSQVPLDQIAAELGIDEGEAAQAARTALPALLGGLQANAADPAGAASLGAALGDHADSPLGLDLGSIDTDDGQRIVQNIFGGQTNDVVAQLGGVRGSGGQGIIGKLLPILAPIVLSYLARKMQERGGLGGVIGDAMGGAAGGSTRGGSSGDGGFGDILGQVLGGGQAGGAQGAGGGELEQPSGPLIPTDGGRTPDVTQGRAGGQPAGGGDILGDILGQVLGGAQSAPSQDPRSSQQAPQSGGSIIDILGGLLGGGKR
ncbi:MAG TPA: DUF937 domain-containing protein [Dermatophilaceae bacterium]|nr:DUF937 domain-containing protein [Dermatophilaceae bacterium]